MGGDAKIENDAQQALDSTTIVQGGGNVIESGITMADDGMKCESDMTAEVLPENRPSWQSGSDASKAWKRTITATTKSPTHRQFEHESESSRSARPSWSESSLSARPSSKPNSRPNSRRPSFVFQPAGPIAEEEKSQGSKDTPELMMKIPSGGPSESHGPSARPSTSSASTTRKKFLDTQNNVIPAKALQKVNILLLDCYVQYIIDLEESLRTLRRIVESMLSAAVFCPDMELQIATDAFHICEILQNSSVRDRILQEKKEGMEQILTYNKKQAAFWWRYLQEVRSIIPKFEAETSP